MSSLLFSQEQTGFLFITLKRWSLVVIHKHGIQQTFQPMLTCSWTKLYVAVVTRMALAEWLWCQGGGGATYRLCWSALQNLVLPPMLLPQHVHLELGDFHDCHHILWYFNSVHTNYIMILKNFCVKPSSIISTRVVIMGASLSKICMCMEDKVIQQSPWFTVTRWEMFMHNNKVPMLCLFSFKTDKAYWWVNMPVSAA